MDWDDCTFTSQHTAYDLHTSSHLNYRGLGARLEGVGQTALAAVLTILVESHLEKVEV